MKKGTKFKLSNKVHPITSNDKIRRKKYIKSMGLLLTAVIIAECTPVKVFAEITTSNRTLDKVIQADQMIQANQVIQADKVIQAEQMIQVNQVKQPDLMVQEVSPTPPPQNMKVSINLGKKITYGSLSKAKKLNSTNMIFLADITEGSLLAVANSNTNVYLSDLSELMSVLVILNKSSLEDVVEIGSEMEQLSDKEYSKFGLKAGDKISVKELLTCYLITRYDDVRTVLVEHVAGSETKFVAMMNQQAMELGLTNTNFISSNGLYSEDQYSMLHDEYLIMYQLLKNKWFTEAMGQDTVEISYQSSDKEQITRACKNQMTEIYGEVAVPEGYTKVAQFTGYDKKALGNQIVLLQDKKDHTYISIINQVPLDRNISKESSALLNVLSGGEYNFIKEETKTISPTPKVTPKPTPSPAVLKEPEEITQEQKQLSIPTSSNNARYQYLLGTNYKAFTMDSPPEGYKTAAQAAKNMTTITVPVWKMTPSGNKYSSTMKLTINKKLVQSCREIFKEIYNLDMKFPFKTLTGFNYRKVGGVGLSKSTLMSVHAFGAAIDINMNNSDNDYFLGAGNDLRDKSNPYCIPDEVIQIFEKNGWFWGGNFSISADTMHFQYLGLEFLTYQGNSPFRTLEVKVNEEMQGVDVKNLQQRLNELGFKVRIDGVYGDSTAEVVKKAQKKFKLKVTGIVDYKTWETIINLTHYMPYVF